MLSGSLTCAAGQATHPCATFVRRLGSDKGLDGAYALPEGTLKALADHGNFGGLLPADGGDGEYVLARFARAGIDIDALAAQLQDEGAKSFVKSWNELLAVIAGKRAALGKAS